MVTVHRSLLSKQHSTHRKASANKGLYRPAMNRTCVRLHFGKVAKIRLSEVTALVADRASFLFIGKMNISSGLKKLSFNLNKCCHQTMCSQLVDLD